MSSNAITHPHLKARFEAIIYAAEEPVTLAQLAALFASELAPAQQESLPASDADDSGNSMAADATAGDDTSVQTVANGEPPSPGKRSESGEVRATQRALKDAAKAVIDDLIKDYTADGDRARGMEIREVAGGYRMATKPEYHDAVRGFIKSLKPALKLSLPALETLAVIAYKQPVTGPEIGEIRGVDSAGVLGGLLARKLITTAGRKQVLGRPILYKTTQEFLLRFGLKDVAELPSLAEFEKMAAEVADFDEQPASPSQAAQEQAALEQAERAEPDVDATTAETDSLAVAVEEDQAAE